MLAVLLSLNVYGTADYINASSSCDRRGIHWVQLYGPCWNSLIKVQATTTWMDITLPIGYALMLLCSIALILYRCTKLSKKYQVERFYENIIKIIATVMIVTAIIKACFFAHLYLPATRAAQTDAISSQLSKSLLKYGHDENITRAWQNTMRECCCCGLHGYQDFTNIGVDVPPQL